MDGNNDDDGVVFTSNMVAGEPATLNVTASATGRLDAWGDFNDNGVFESSEKIFHNYPLAAGSNALSFNVPADAEPNFVEGSFFRFRLSSQGKLGPAGPAGDGEVEDYMRKVYVRPEVDSIVIDDGTAQRSMVRTATVEFNQGVTLDPGAIQVETDDANPQPVPFTLSSTTVNDRTVATLTFSGTGGSLGDGRYTITVDKDKVHVGPIYMAADHVDSFFRFFSDKDGNGSIAFVDFMAIVNALANYDDDFDFDGSNDVSFSEFIVVVSRFGTQLP